MYNQFWNGGGRENPKDLWGLVEVGGAGRGGPRLLIVKVVCLFFVLALHTRTHTSFSGRGGGKHSSVGPVGGAAIAGLAALGFLLHAVGLIALTGTTLWRETSHSVNNGEKRETGLLHFISFLWSTRFPASGIFSMNLSTDTNDTIFFIYRSRIGPDATDCLALSIKRTWLKFKPSVTIFFIKAHYILKNN